MLTGMEAQGLEGGRLWCGHVELESGGFFSHHGLRYGVP
jgi:hypothetical protein